MAASGKIGAMTMSFCSHFHSPNLPVFMPTSTRMSSSASTPETATMRWYTWKIAFTGSCEVSSAPYCSLSASVFRPGYSVSGEPVARMLVKPGIAMPATLSLPSSTQPNRYSGTASSSYWPSIAASLVGCSFHTPSAVECADTNSASVATSVTTAPVLSVFFANSRSRPFRKRYAAIDTATRPPITSAAVITWK